MFHSSVGYEQKYSDRERGEHKEAAAEHDIEQANMAAARKRMLDKERVSKGILSLEAQQPVTLDLGDGETREYNDAVAAHELEIPNIDASVKCLLPLCIRMIEDVFWPFKRKGSRVGVRPVFTEGVWEYVIDYGQYCMRCFNRHETEFPDECEHCGLTSEHRERAMAQMEADQQMYHHRQNTINYVVEQETRRSSGIVLPNGVIV